MRRIRATAKLLLFLTVAAPLRPTDATANNLLSRVTLSEAETRIALAERQRLLAARLAMVTCLLDLQLAVPHFRARLGKMQMDFDYALMGLRDSDDRLGIQSLEQDPAVLRSHAAVLETWVELSKALHVMRLTGSFEAPFADRVYTHSGPLAEQVATLSRAIAQAHADTISAPPGEANATTTPLRDLRLLAHTASTDLCLAATGWQPEKARERLAQTLAKIEALRSAIAFSPIDISATPQAPSGDAALTDALRIWDKVHDLAADAARGKPIDGVLLGRMIQTTEAMLSTPPGTRRTINTH